MSDRVTLRHHGIEAHFAILSSVFHVTPDGLLHWAVEAEIADEDDEESPRDLLVAVHGCEMPAPGSAVAVQDTHEDWTETGETPRAYVYSTFHHPYVDIRFELDSPEGDELGLSFTATTDDPRYYDERAQPSTIQGRCTLSRAPLGDVWRP